MTETGYVLDDVRAAERKILAAVPDAMFAKTDYGFGLAVLLPGMAHAIIVYQPERSESGQEEIVGDVDRIIATLKGL